MSSSDGFILAAWEPFDEIAIQPMRLVGEGRYPSAGQQEIAVEKRMADKHGLSVGDADRAALRRRRR